jgi:hypothetical protein
VNGPERIFDRFSNWFGSFFDAIDQLLAVWIRGWSYVWFGIGELPSADETISAWVGRNAIAGNRIALIAEKFIDFLMGAGHCRGAIARDDND